MTDQPTQPHDIVPPPADSSEESLVAASLEASIAHGAELETLRQDKAALEEEIKRAQAQVENMRARCRRDVENAHAYANQKFAECLLPVIDSLEQGLEASQGDDVPAQYREGLELTLSLFTKALKDQGIEAVDALHQPYDPDWHEAIVSQPSDEHPSKTVLTVVQKGYRLKTRVLRPAKVIVSA